MDGRHPQARAASECGQALHGLPALAGRPGDLRQTDGMEVGALGRTHAGHQGGSGRRRDHQGAIVVGRSTEGPRRLCRGIETARGASTLSARFWNRLSRAMTAEAITCAGAIVLLLWLVLYPLLMLLIGSLRTDLPQRPGAFTLANFVNHTATTENL